MGTAQTVFIAAVVLALGACGRRADTTPPSFGAACATDDDCKPPFSCIGGQASPHSCSKTCTTDGDCPRYHWSPPCSSEETDVQSTCGDGSCHAFIACQPGWDGGEPDRPISTLSPHASLAGLSAADQDRLCQEVLAYVSSTLLPEKCVYDAFQATADAAARNPNASDDELRAYCATSLAACPSTLVTGTSVPGQDGGSDGGETCAFSRVAASCAATVADEERCLADSDTLYGAAPPCERLTRSLLATLSYAGLDVALPPSCAAITTCVPPDSGGL